MVQMIIWRVVFWMLNLLARWTVFVLGAAVLSVVYIVPIYACFWTAIRIYFWTGDLAGVAVASGSLLSFLYAWYTLQESELKPWINGFINWFLGFFDYFLVARRAVWR